MRSAVVQSATQTSQARRALLAFVAVQPRHGSIARHASRNWMHRPLPGHSLFE
jgi:hypothetical protein